MLFIQYRDFAGTNIPQQLNFVIRKEISDIMSWLCILT